MSMRMTTAWEELELIRFVERASEDFEAHPEHITYTDGEIVPGCLFAVRWGLGKDCVLVFKLDEFFQPVNYQNVITKENHHE